MEDALKNLRRDVVLALVGLIGISAAALAQSSQTGPIAGYTVAKDYSGASELPDPNMTYKVVFDVTKVASKVNEVNPGLIGVAQFVNTLAKYGVPADHRKIAVVFHQDAVEIVQDDEAFKAHHDGHENPNISLIQNMKKAGVDFRVNGQAVSAKKIDPKTILPEIEVDLWTEITLANLQVRGYVHIQNY
jgi:intracellular sulfur oxidation DsrE/DsrF family protein